MVRWKLGTVLWQQFLFILVLMIFLFLSASKSSFVRFGVEIRFWSFKNAAMCGAAVRNSIALSNSVLAENRCAACAPRFQGVLLPHSSQLLSSRTDENQSSGRWAAAADWWEVDVYSLWDSNKYHDHDTKMITQKNVETMIQRKSNSTEVNKKQGCNWVTLTVLKQKLNRCNWCEVSQEELKRAGMKRKRWKEMKEWCQNQRQDLRSFGKMMEVGRSSYRQNLFLDPIAIQS